MLEAGPAAAQELRADDLARAIERRSSSTSSDRRRSSTRSTPSRRHHHEVQRAIDKHAKVEHKVEHRCTSCSRRPDVRPERRRDVPRSRPARPSAAGASEARRGPEYTEQALEDAAPGQERHLRPPEPERRHRRHRRRRQRRARRGDQARAAPERVGSARRCCRASRSGSRSATATSRCAPTIRGATGRAAWTTPCPLPRDANVILRSVSGDIRVSTLNGESARGIDERRRGRHVRPADPSGQDHLGRSGDRRQRRRRGVGIHDQRHGHRPRHQSAHRGPAVGLGRSAADRCGVGSHVRADRCPATSSSRDGCRRTVATNSSPTPATCASRRSALRASRSKRPRSAATCARTTR